MRLFQLVSGTEIVVSIEPWNRKIKHFCGLFCYNRSVGYTSDFSIID